MSNLEKKSALITGASHGIGRATARAMASAGAYVLVHYGKSGEEADSLVGEIQGAGGQAGREVLFYRPGVPHSIQRSWSG